MLGVAAAGFSGLGAHAAPAKPAIVDPPPPASLENRDVEAWASAYVRSEPWTLITHDAEGAHFTRPDQATARSPSHVEADVRTELFRPVKLGPGWARSGVARWAMDCSTGRYAVLSMTVFSHNNLKGELARKPAADPDWIEPNEFQTTTINVICKAVLSGQPLERPLTAQSVAPL